MGDAARLCEVALGRPVVTEDTLGRGTDTERRPPSPYASPLCRLDELPDVLPLRCRNPVGRNFDFLDGETASLSGTTTVGVDLTDD